MISQQQQFNEFSKYVQQQAKLVMDQGPNTER
jgi:hypothetical protein